MSADVQEWAEDLAGRALDPAVLRGLRRKGRRGGGQELGLSPATIAQWLSAVSSFYRFVSTRYLVRTEDGGERPLHAYNPAANVRRPEVEAYTESEFLDARALARLLGAIPRDTVGGLRDYALFLGYVLTGRRNAEWRQIRWGDLRGRGARIYYTWRGKKTEQARNELPPPVWEAIRDYLEAGGAGWRRWGRGILCLRRCRTGRRGCRMWMAGAWDGNRALSAGEVNRLLKRYARQAGLDDGADPRARAAALGGDAGGGAGDEPDADQRVPGARGPEDDDAVSETPAGGSGQSWREKTALLGLE